MAYCAQDLDFVFDVFKTVTDTLLVNYFDGYFEINISEVRFEDFAICSFSQQLARWIQNIIPFQLSYTLC